MVEILRSLHLLGQTGGRIVVDALVALFENDVALSRDHVFAQHKAGHAIGFELHHGAEILARDALEVSSVVVAGEGVFLTADGGNLLREASARMVRGALEHQVFEEMRDAGLSVRIIGRADPIPEHVGDDGRAVIGHDHDLHPVVERELLDGARRSR